jgi:hypothetical protein
MSKSHHVFGVSVAKPAQEQRGNVDLSNSRHGASHYKMRVHVLPLNKRLDAGRDARGTEHCIHLTFPPRKERTLRTEMHESEPCIR